MPHTRRFLLSISAIALFSFSFTSLAEIKINGLFIAKAPCSATTSIRKAPKDNLHLTVDMAYEVLSKNKPDATHYKIIVKQAKPKMRWVAVSCGTLLSDSKQTTVKGAETNDGNNAPAAHNNYLLALSWQPSFCHAHREKPECKNPKSTKYRAKNLTLHGLWPQPRENAYCGVSEQIKQDDKAGKWSTMPATGLSAAELKHLENYMPGVASDLQRHEWYKHGTCYGTSANEYFDDAISLQKQVNESVFGDFLRANIGQEITFEQVQRYFDEAFGSGASTKVQMKCSKPDPTKNNRTMLTEIWINLKGQVDPNTSLASLLPSAANAASYCDRAYIDPIGY